MKKSFSKLLTLFVSLLLLFSVTLSPVATARQATTDHHPPTTGQPIQAITFSNRDFYLAAKKLYDEQKLSQSDFELVSTALSERWGIKGENKIIPTGPLTFDLYLNSVLSTLVVAGGIVAAGAIILTIPPIAAWIAAHGATASALSAVLTAAVGSYTNADNGLIFTLRAGGLGTFTCIGVRDQ